MKTVSEYCETNILVVPQALFGMLDVSVLASHGDSIVFYKHLAEDLLDVEFYTNRPCLIYIEHGQETITTSDNQVLELNAGSALLLPQGYNLHSDYVQTTESLKAYLVFFGDDVISSYLRGKKRGSSHAKGEAALFCMVKDNGGMKGFFDSIQLNHKAGLNSPDLLNIKLQELLHLLSWCDQNEGVEALLSTSQTVAPKRNLTRLMQKTDVLKLSVRDLANLSGRSLSSFNREFKATYHTPPKQWLQERRLSFSKELLENQEVSVTEVALQVGYENVSHFIKAFKSQYGVTPKKYMQQ